MKISKKVFALFVVLALISAQLIAQESSESVKNLKKQEKIDKKKLKEEAEKAEWEEYKQIIESKRFVFQATDIFTASGAVPLDQKTNFFYVMDDDAVIQLSFMGLQSVPTVNGLGGITIEGKVTKYVVKADNYKKPIRLSVTVKPSAGQGQGIHNLNLTIFGEGYAELLLPNGNVRLKGSVIRPQDSKIHIGSTR